MQHGGVMKFQGGGSFAANVSQPAEDRFNSTNAILQAVASMPPQIVLVEDMNSAQANLVQVQTNAEF
jgi:xanthine dehydrogenase iron-sulfur cluster and FAD-binding subunit A